MMRYITVITCSLFLFSCSDSFINHKLKFEKLGGCSGISQPVKMISNINGERYEFSCCFDDGFDGKNYKVERKGDSILVRFPKTDGKQKAQYKLVLDIDAKPRYNHILLDEQGLTIAPSNR